MEFVVGALNTDKTNRHESINTPSTLGMDLAEHFMGMNLDISHYSCDGCNGGELTGRAGDARASKFMQKKTGALTVSNSRQWSGRNGHVFEKFAHLSIPQKMKGKSLSLSCTSCKAKGIQRNCYYYYCPETGHTRCALCIANHHLASSHSHPGHKSVPILA
jgi:hypothetical protein